MQEYLVAESTHTKHPLYHIDEQDAHMKLALLCMCYIVIYLQHGQRSCGYKVSRPNAHTFGALIDDLDIVSCPIRRRRPTLTSSEPRPLLPYVRSCGFQHLGHVDPANREVLRALETFQSDVQPHSLEWEQLCERSRPLDDHWPSLKHDLVLYILIAFAPAELLRLYMDYAPLKPKDGTNPLTYAASSRKIEHAKILLSKGFRVDRKGWDTGEHRQVLPLEVAAKRRNHSMVHLFLTEGSPVPYELFDATVREYSRISSSVASKLLQTDEFVEWATLVRDDERRLLRMLDPTHYIGGCPSEEDIESIERRLVQIGCDTSARFDETSLRHAVRAGHISIVKRMLLRGIPLPSDIILDASSSEMICLLLNLGSSTHVVSSHGDTPLHLAMRASGDECLETVQILIDAGCDPSACNLAGETPLHVAVHLGDCSMVDHLLSLGVPLPPDILLETPRLWMVRFLLDVGADVHATTASGNTVLHGALEHPCFQEDPCLELTKVLINAGCDPCSPNALGEAPINVAAKRGHLQVVQHLISLNISLPSDILLSVVSAYSPASMIKFLLDKGADIHVTSPNGDNLLFVSITECHTVLGKEEECLEKLKILISAGCDPYICNTAGESLFCVAARQRYITILEFLLSRGVPTPSGLTIAQFGQGCSLRGSSKTIRFLLDKGGDIHTVTEIGDTLLHLAVPAGSEVDSDALDLVKRLVRSGCSPYAVNSKQETPLHIAAQSGCLSLISYFLSLGQSLPSDILLTALTGCHCDKAKVIRYLIRQGADVSATAKDGTTPLHLLATLGYEHDCLESTKILIDAGCNPRSPDTYGRTPMCIAAKHGYISVVEFLLSQGIPPPQNILFVSTARILRFFLNKGIDIQSTTVSMWPLHCALDPCGTEEDRLERARILVGAGCDPSQDLFGETPIHIAVGNNDMSVIKYLLSQNAPLPSDILLAAVPTVEDIFSKDRVPLYSLLLREGADANVSKEDGDTPLHLLVRLDFIEYGRYYRNMKSVEVLLNGGANPFIENAHGKSAFDLAAENGQFYKDNFLRLVRNCVIHRLERRKEICG